MGSCNHANLYRLRRCPRPIITRVGTNPREPHYSVGSFSAAPAAASGISSLKRDKLMFSSIWPASWHDEDCPMDRFCGSPEWSPSRATRDLVPFGNWVASRYSCTCSARDHCVELVSEKNRSGKARSGNRRQRGVHPVGGCAPRQRVFVLRSAIASSGPVAGKVLSYRLRSGQSKIVIDFGFAAIVAVILRNKPRGRGGTNFPHSWVHSSSVF